MNKTIFALLVLVALGCSGGAPPTQTVQPVRAVPPQPARDATGNILTQSVTIPEGTEFTVQTLDFLSSQNAAQGDPIHLEVQNNVLVDGAIAIAAGSPVKGVISSVTHASRMGKAGNISVRIESGETVDGQRIRLRATKAQSTDDKVGSVVALTVLVSPLFLLKKGNDVAYQPGTVVTVYADERLSVRAWKR